MKKNIYVRDVDKPLMHPCHKRPVTRREFVSQGFAFGAGLTFSSGSLYSLLGSNKANAFSADIETYLENNPCGGYDSDNAKIPFICFDLAGGANFAGSSVLVGGAGGQEDFLSTSGYQKMGLPPDQTPNLDSANNRFIDDSFGLKFHSDSPYLRGLKEFAAAAGPNTNGAVIPARSENDTGNNPHNPTYAIARYATSILDPVNPSNGLITDMGSSGSLLSLIGSRNSESGGNSMAPMAYLRPEFRPTKIDNAQDAMSLVNTGALADLLGRADTGAVMESIFRLSNAKLGKVGVDDVIADLVRCNYLDAASNAQQTPSDLNPDDRMGDGIIVSDNEGIFSEAEYDNDREFRKTAAVMKMVVDGYAGAGTITMGGYDYHGGRRSRGEARDLRAGRCIGACLEYARRANNGQGKPLMIYVFSDGSLSSNGVTEGQPGAPVVDRNDDNPGGRGKGEWVSDNQQTACSWFLVYNPDGRPELKGVTPEQQARHQQLGYFRSSGDVETTSSPVANNVNLLVDAVVLNYMALHGDEGQYENLFNNSLGNASIRDSLIAFNSII